ncbi:MAG TPA: hypothetical protein VN700_17745 [Vicinamibacterales bacterium]|nr:hypothetical protein [Vicinamibacterales bacterium]
MASEFDRDNSVDHLLKGARRNAGAAHEAGPACLDAETLAAWSDDGVDADRAREIEMHVASCTRCQEMSAAFFRTEEAAATPAAATTVLPFKRNRLMYWLPIAAGIAATVVVWLNLPQRETPAADLTLSKAAPAEAPASASPTAGGFGRAQPQQGQSSAAAGAGAANRQLAEQKSVQRLDQLTAAQLRKERVAKPAAPAPVKPDAAPIQPPAGRVGGVVGGVAGGLAAAAPPPPPVIAPPPTPTPTPAVTAAAPIIVPTQNAQTRAASESFAFRAGVEPRVVAEFSSNDQALSLTLSRVAGGGAGAGGGRGGGGAGRGGGRGGAPAMVVADASKAEGVAHWRILATGAVERSPDRMVWTAIAIDPPPQGLAAGAAPFPNVCWLAGKGGLVLLSTDGRTFTRVTAPTDADLDAVAASNALQATVRTIDGRTFITTNGGKTWR